MLQTLLFFLICFLCTTMGAISGIGGGVIIKPLMDCFSGFSASTISFLSGVTVESMAVVSIIEHYAHKESTKLELRRGTLLAIGSVIGGIAGKTLFQWFKDFTGHDVAVTIGQNAILLCMVIVVFVYYLKKDHIQTYNIQNGTVCVSVGLILGLLSSFLGIGGGPINLMVLSLAFSMDTKAAALHSLYIILFSQSASIATVLISRNVPEFSWPVMIAMALGGILGAYVGRMISERWNSAKVEHLFRGMLVIIMFVCVLNIIRQI